MKHLSLIATVFLVSCATQPVTADEQHEVLTIHNQFRAKHGAAPLVWSPKLARYAARYASNCRFQHSHGPYGENLAAGYPSITNAVTAWYDEKDQYHYQHPVFSLQTGHFTQLVWKSTKSLGCAYVSCDGKHGTPGRYLVCEYDPPGNVANPGYFTANVA